MTTQINKEEYLKLVILAEKQLKHTEKIKTINKNYYQNNKNTEHHKEVNREKAKRFYLNNREKILNKRYKDKHTDDEIFQLMQIIYI